MRIEQPGAIIDFAQIYKYAAAYGWGYKSVQPTDFKSDGAGKTLRVNRPPIDYWAFVPRPLPPKHNISREIYLATSAADQALSELAGAARNLPNPYLLINQFMRREAVLSSRIEGTQASLSDLLYFEAAEEKTPKTVDVREVHNYVRALEFGLKRLSTLPVSLRLIRELHEKLMSNVRGQERTPGEFRASQNWIGSPGGTLMDATYVPPPLSELMPCLGDLEKYLHAPVEMPQLLRLSYIHYQFEAIHPFLDGNGRVGRLLIPLLLCEWKILPQPLLYLSAYFEKNRSAYYDGLLAVSRKAAWEDWAIFFLRGIEQQSKDALKRAVLLQELAKNYRLRLQQGRESAVALKLADQLFSTPILTVSAAEKHLGVTYATANLHVNRFVRQGILRKATLRNWNRVFIAPEIMHIIEASTAEEAEKPPSMSEQEL